MSMEREIFYKGVSSSPSDYQCEDGALAECTGLRNDDGAWRATRRPVAEAELAAGMTLLYVHSTTDGGEHYIVTDGKAVMWTDDPAGQGQKMTDRTATSVTAVGNVLCVATTEGVVYAAWRDGAYSVQESPLARPRVQFGLRGEWRVMDDEGTVWFSPLQYNDEKYELIAMKNDVIASQSASSQISLTANASQGALIASGRQWGVRLDSEVSLTATFSVTISYADGTTETKTNVTSSSDTGTFITTAAKDIKTVEALYTVTHKGGNVHPSVQLKIVDYGVGGWMRMGTDGIAAVKAKKERYLAKMREEKKMVYPFFAQVGLRMYDGNIVAISAPCLMVTNTGCAPIVMSLHSVSGSSAQAYITKEEDGVTYRGAKTMTGAVVASLNMKLLAGWSIDSNIYQSLVVAMSEQVSTCDDGSEQEEQYYLRDVHVEGSSYLMTSTVKSYTHINNSGARGVFNVPARQDIEDALLQASAALYVVKEIPVKEIPAAGMWTDVDLSDVDLSALSGRERMPLEDVSREALCGGKLYVYNGRLHAGGYEEQLFEGYGVGEMCGVNSITACTTATAVDIEEDGAQCSVRCVDSGQKTSMNFFFYPRTGASRAVMQQATGDKKRYEIALKKHPYRSGCYWFDGFGSYVENEAATLREIKDRLNRSEYIRVSEVNNPYLMSNAATFSFGAAVKAMGAAVTALSQGQMGQFDLYVFTGEGIWSLKMSDEGKYLKQVPVARDVIAGDGRSLCLVDGSVVFGAERGVMVLTGASCKCISDMLTESVAGSGLKLEDIRRYVDGCLIAYDYVGQRLIVGNSAHDYVYVYSMRASAWTVEMMTVTGVVNSYPHAKVVTGAGQVVNLSAAVAADYDETGAGHLMTRALKLGDNNSYKRVTHVRQNGLYRDEKMSQKLLASNDLRNWVCVVSANGGRMTVAAGGTAYRFYAVAVDVELAAGEYLTSMTMSYALVDNARLM